MQAGKKSNESYFFINLHMINEGIILMINEGIQLMEFIKETRKMVLTQEMTDFRSWQEKQC